MPIQGDFYQIHALSACLHIPSATFAELKFEPISLGGGEMFISRAHG